MGAHSLRVWEMPLTPLSLTLLLLFLSILTTPSTGHHQPTTTVNTPNTQEQPQGQTNVKDKVFDDKEENANLPGSEKLRVVSRSSPENRLHTDVKSSNPSIVDKDRIVKNKNTKQIGNTKLLGINDVIEEAVLRSLKIK